MLSAEIRSIASLSEADKERMYRVMVDHYARMEEGAFLDDMAEKDGVILLSDEDSQIQGFSTYLHMHSEYQGEEVVALFSGDTIIDQCFWGSQALFRAFGRLLHSLMEENPGKRRYWFLITKGFRTYLLLPLFFKTFYPRWDQETPVYEAGLIEHFAAKKYNGQFDRERGIIAADSYFLNGELAEIPERKMQNRHVKFFLEKNPLYTRGEELACVCEINSESFRRRTRSLVRA